jgi:hypothetical protein
LHLFTFYLYRIKNFEKAFFIKVELNSQQCAGFHTSQNQISGSLPRHEGSSVSSPAFCSSTARRFGFVDSSNSKKQSKKTASFGSK